MQRTACNVFALRDMHGLDQKVWQISTAGVDVSMSLSTCTIFISRVCHFSELEVSNMTGSLPDSWGDLSHVRFFFWKAQFVC